MKNIILNAIRLSSEKSTKEHLGDRRKYIGASDLAGASDCLRKIALSKAGELSDSEDSGKSILTKERGHWYEAGILSALMDAGHKLIPQLEISFVENDIPHAFHLDFIFFTETGTIEVLELKTTRQDKPTLFSSYPLQIKSQLTALARYWDSPAFRINKEDELVPFPDLIEKLFGLRPLKEISGEIVSITTKDDIESYGPYTPCDDVFWDDLMKLSQRIVESAKDPYRVSFARGFYPLCDYCSHQPACPKFRSVEATSITPLLERYIKVDDAISQLVGAKKELAENLTNYYLSVRDTLPDKGAYIHSSFGGKFKFSESQRTTFSKDSVGQALENFQMTQDTMDSFVPDSQGNYSLPKNVIDELIKRSGSKSPTSRFTVVRPN